MNLINYYNNYNEDARVVSSNVRKVEFLTNINFLDKHIAKVGRILDVGAGTGIYSFYYANKGYNVNAIDYMPKHVDQMQSKANGQKFLNGSIEIEQGNALDLSRFCDNLFDSVICFGPIYHLREQSDREQCIRECMRVLKPGGIFAVAYINKYYVVPAMVGRNINILSESNIADILESGNLKDTISDEFLSISHFDTPEEIESLLKKFNLKILTQVASDGIVSFIDSDINALSQNEYELWLDYHFKTCTEKSMLGVSNHGMIITKKK